MGWGSVALVHSAVMFAHEIFTTHSHSPSPLGAEQRRCSPSVPALPGCSEGNQISSNTSGCGTAFSVNVILSGIIVENTNYQK